MWTVYTDSVDINDFSVFQQDFFIVDGYLGQLVKMIDHLASNLAGQISVFNFANV